jgi:hypothetical protein
MAGPEDSSSEQAVLTVRAQRIGLHSITRDRDVEQM